MPKPFATLEKSLRLRGLAAELQTAVECAPVPDVARSLAPGVLKAARGPALQKAWKGCAAEICRIVANLCGGAPFLAPILERHPEWVPELATDALSSERSADEYQSRLSTWLGDRHTPDEVAVALREFKYYELARITARDLDLERVPLEATPEILNELSHLADALLQQSLTCAEGWAIQRRSSTAAKSSAVTTPGFAVIGMGKLGSEELNYSSDVDLIYVCTDDVAANRGELDLLEHYTKIAEEFGRLVRRNTGDGFLYRVDLELRPEGKSGPLVVTLSTLSDYYERWAETWEEAAFMKARPVAGDLGFGWKAIRAMDPIIYTSSMDLGGVEAIRAMKDRIEKAKGRDTSTFNVKLGKGGIRDIEFVAQALQMVHGGRRPQVRQRSTQAALQALAEAGALDRGACEILLKGYRFLRRVENRIQMESERQQYRLPSTAAGSARLARSLGCGDETPGETFHETLESHRNAVQKVFADLFDKEDGGQILELFQRNAPGLLANPATRSMLENLADQLATRVVSSSCPERAMNNLEHFIIGVGRRKFFYELLLDRPELVPRLVRLFAASEYLSTYVATHPRLIEPLFDDPDVLLHSRDDLEASFQDIRKALDDEDVRVEPELSLDALRLFHNRELVNVGLLDMDDRISRADAEGSLTEIAEVCVERGLELAESEVTRRAGKQPTWLRKGEFLVVAMGKLASRELTYGSDLDVIFLYDLPGSTEDQQLAAQSGFVGLAQKLIWTLQTRTTEGVCYEIDARLRPSGNQGLLVSHIETFEAYHARTAAPWERQALLRSRPVAGSQRLASVFEQLRSSILRRENPAGLRDEIHRIRSRMEAELARESSEHHDFKIGRGGLLDIETAVQTLQLENAVEHPKLIEPRTIAEQIELLASLAILDVHDARVFADGWEFLQRLSSRLRILENRSISDLDSERGDLDDVAKRLGYQAPGRSSGARRALLNEYQSRTSEIRDVYEKVLQVSTASAPTPAAAEATPAKKSGARRLARRRTAAQTKRRHR